MRVGRWGFTCAAVTMSKQTVYAANHKQWSDSLVLTEDGRFWRTAGFRGWSETSKSAGRWEYSSDMRLPKREQD